MKPGDEPPSGKVWLKTSIGIIALLAAGRTLFFTPGSLDAMQLLGAIACMLVAAILLSPLLAGALGGVAGSVYHSGQHLKVPPPIYSTPRARRAFGQLEEAIILLEEITETHPQELDAWRELLEISTLELGDQARGERYLARGLSALKQNTARQQLTQHWKVVLERRAARQALQPSVAELLEADAIAARDPKNL